MADNDTDEEDENIATGMLIDKTFCTVSMCAYTSYTTAIMICLLLLLCISGCQFNKLFP